MGLSFCVWYQLCVLSFELTYSHIFHPDVFFCILFPRAEVASFTCYIRRLLFPLRKKRLTREWEALRIRRAHAEQALMFSHNLCVE